MTAQLAVINQLPSIHDAPALEVTRFSFSLNQLGPKMKNAAFTHYKGLLIWGPQMSTNQSTKIGNSARFCYIFLLLISHFSGQRIGAV
jgi:hypothetical protein